MSKVFEDLVQGLREFAEFTNNPKILHNINKILKDNMEELNLTPKDNILNYPIKITEDIIHKQEETDEKVVYNPLKTIKDLKVGDKVYDSENGHKLEILSMEPDKYSYKVVFKDLDDDKEITLNPGIRYLFELVIDDEPVELDEDMKLKESLIDKVDSLAKRGKYTELRNLSRELKDELEEEEEYFDDVDKAYYNDVITHIDNLLAEDSFDD